MASTRTAWALSAVTAAGILGTLVRIIPVAISQQTSPRAARHLFRITVGLTDREARVWNGSVQVDGGELARIEGYRLGPKESAGNGGSFRFTTEVGNFEDQLRTMHPYGQTDWNSPEIRRVVPQGLIVEVGGPSSARVRFACESGTFDFEVGRVALRAPLTVLGGNGMVERLPVETLVSEEGRADDYPAIAAGPDGETWIAWLSYEKEGDEVTVHGGGNTVRVTEKGDHHAPAIAVDRRGWVYCVWSRNDAGAFHVYGSVRVAGRWSTAQKLSSQGGSHIWPHLVSDGGERLALVWQALRGGQSVILGRLWDGANWGAERRLSEGAGNAWTPSAAFGGGRLYAAWDSYNTGSYQVFVREWNDAAPQRVTQGDNFSVRASIAVTHSGMPIVAWEESDPLWGKDFAFLTDRRGTTLYKNRRIGVAYSDAGLWRQPAPVADAMPVQIRRYLQQPRLAVDDTGRVFLALRSRTSANTSRIDNWAAGGRWETYVSQLTGDRWLPAVPMPSSVGRNGMRPAIAVAGQIVRLAWPSDSRAFPGGAYGDMEVFTATLPAVGGSARLRGGSPTSGDAAAPANPHPNEAEDTRRIRDYRVRIDGKAYRILRGDLHRHTELSPDGAGDGSLDDLYRYALDAALMDYGHVADHQMGTDEEYNWWLTQKSNDLYHMPERFVVLYGYERSVPWPNGHRNVIWPNRGRPVLRIGDAERQGKANSGPILYPYLRQTGGIVTSHTSATEQGTDWRDNDPALEPIVEMYQGFESSYEHAGAPRAWKEGMKAVHQGLRPQGFVWEAWKKGYKLGVQASSDHVSTHTSYACILVEDFTREGLVDAMRRRHTYAATDNIIVDYRARTSQGTALMGDITQSASPPVLAVRVAGTAPLREVVVVKNNAYVHKQEPNAREVSFEYVDNAFGPGESYYYVRVEQTDGQLAWSSPIWVKKSE